MHTYIQILVQKGEWPDSPYVVIWFDAMDKVVLSSSNKPFCKVFYEIAVNEVIKLC